VLQRHNQFVTCDVCRRVFWEGTHWQRMRALMDSVAAAPVDADADADARDADASAASP
jgi:uncharacterized protein with PIN domain